MPFVPFLSPSRIGSVMAASLALVDLGVSVRAVPFLPPATDPTLRQQHLWARIASEVGAHPVGSWVAIEGVERATPYGANALVVACRRAGFRVAVRQRPDALYVLRGRQIAP